MAGKIPYYKAEEIAEKSWMIQNAHTESSYALCYLVEGDDYALLIDSILGMGNLKAFCETLTDKPIRLVNTHSHSDHVGGNPFYYERYQEYIRRCGYRNTYPPDGGVTVSVRSWKWRSRWPCRSIRI